MKTFICLTLIFALSLAGGIHRVAQSQWDIANEGHNDYLHLYFMLDNALVKEGTMAISFPDSKVVPTDCDAWAVTGTSLTAPTTYSSYIKGTISGASSPFYCTWESDLAAGTTYGMRLNATANTATAGTYAPVGLTTRSGSGDSDKNQGPMVDSNPVFDSYTVTAAPKTFAITAAPVANEAGCSDKTPPDCNDLLKHPGETKQYEFTLNTFNQASGAIWAPYNIELTLDAIANNDAANGGHVYENWVWGTNCTNTQFGAPVTTSSGTTTPKMKVVQPTCTATGTKLKIAVTEGSDGINPGSNWSTFVMKFLISLKNPKDWLGQAAKVSGKITKPGSTQVIATAPSVDISNSGVEKLTTGADTTSASAGNAGAKLGWGYDPLSSAAEKYLGGIRADHHCLQKKFGGGGIQRGSNCLMISNADASNAADNTGGLPILNINAIELTWTLPTNYDIPNDGTTAVMKCDATYKTAKTFTIYQSSVVTKIGTDQANCWFSETNSHSGGDARSSTITCKNVGALKGGATLQFAFQANFNNARKSWDNANGVVSTDNGDFICQLDIKTAQKVPGTATWYSQKITLPIDGGSTKGYHKYETFFYENGNNAVYQSFKAGKLFATDNAVRTTGYNQANFDMVEVMPTAYNPTQAAYKKYQAASTTKVSPLFMFMMYWSDSADMDGTRLATEHKRSRRLPFNPKGLYDDQTTWKLQIVLAGKQTISTAGFKAYWFDNKLWDVKQTANPTNGVPAWGLNAAEADALYNTNTNGGCDVRTFTGAFDINADNACPNTKLAEAWGSAVTGADYAIFETSKLGYRKTGITYKALGTTTFPTAGYETVKACLKTPLDSSDAAVQQYYMFQWCHFKGVTATGENILTPSDPTGTAAATTAVTYLRDAWTATLNFDQPHFYYFYYKDAWDYANTDHMTSFRGRGGLDTSQAIDQHIWAMRSNITTGATNAWAVTGLIHTYIGPKAAQAAQSASSGAAVSWPYWVEPTSSDTILAEQQYGNYVWNIFKITLKEGTANEGNFIGTFMPHGLAFMASTGSNQVVSVHSYDTSGKDKCYIYGSEYGEGQDLQGTPAQESIYEKSGTLNPPADAAAVLVTQFYQPYQADYIWLGSNFIVCDITSRASTVGGVVVVPFRNLYVNAQGAPVANGAQSNGIKQWKTWIHNTIDAKRNNIHTFVTVFGADRYMHVMSVMTKNTWSDANWWKTVALDGADMALTAGASNVFDGTLKQAGSNQVITPTIAATDSAKFEIGAQATAVTLTLTAASAVQSTWTNIVEITQTCGDSTYLLGSNIGGMTTGADKTSMSLTQQVVQAGTTNKIWDVQCWYSYGNAASGAVIQKLTKFNLPVTTDRKFTGISGTYNGAQNLKVLPHTTKAATTLFAIADITECSATSSALSKNIPGQAVFFSLTAANALAGGWTAVWRLASGAAATENFNANVADSSVSATCGTTVLTGGSFTYEADNKHIKYTLPTTGQTVTGVPTGNTLSRATYQPICDKGQKLTLNINSWSPKSTDEKSTTAGECLVVMTAGNHASTTVGEHGAGLNANKKFSFKQNGATAQSKFTVPVRKFYPNVQNSMGYLQFSVAAGSGISLYAGQSKFAVTFGGVNFSAENVCQVLSTDGKTHQGGVQSCEASGAIVTIITSGATTGFNVFVRRAMTGITFASTAGKLTGQLKNYNVLVQEMINSGNTQAALPALPAAMSDSTTTVTLAKTNTFTLDAATFNFTVTLKKANGTFDSSQYAMVSFPTYYGGNLGGNLLCSLVPATGSAEDLYCRMAWDWTLQIWGPSSAAQVKGTAFQLLVTGVRAVPGSAAKNIQVAISNSNTTSTDFYQEFGTVADTLIASASSWKAKQALDVYSITAGTGETRSSTTFTVNFGLPSPTSSVTNDLANAYVSLELPGAWGQVFLSSTKGPSSATISQTKAGATTQLGSTISGWTGNRVYVALDADKKFEDGLNYTLVVAGVPTPQFEQKGALGSFIVSIGKTAANEGSYAWSDSQQFGFAQPSFAVKTGLTELKFSASTISVTRGTYSGAYSILPAKNNFGGAVSFTVDSPFKSWPEKLSAVQGQASVSGSLGIASSAQAKYYYATFKKDEGSASNFTPLPTFLVQVTSGKATINVPSTATCTLNGTSIPMLATICDNNGDNCARPFADVSVALVVTPYNVSAANAVNPSKGITPTAGANKVSFSTTVSSGYLSFACGNETASSATLTYEQSGTDNSTYSLSSPTVSVTSKKPVAFNADAVVTWTLDDKSTAPKTVVSGKCPDMGTAFGWFAPEGTAAPADASIATTARAQIAVQQADPNYNGADVAQYCEEAVLTSDSNVECTFDSVSNTNYTTRLYCLTTSSHTYSSKLPNTVTSKDNGGKTVQVSYTFTKAINDITDNAVVLDMACAVAKGITVANNRVTDAYGGYCGVPSKYLPAVAPVKATPATNTTNTTAKTNTTSNTTANKTNSTRRVLTANKTYTVSLFVLPDPTAAAVDNSVWLTRIQAVQADVDKVTSAKYGTSKATVATGSAGGAITEVAIAWGTAPTAAAATNQLISTISGSTSVGGYVYCAFQTKGTKTTTLRLLANTTNTTNATTTTTTTTTTTANATVASVKQWTSASFSAANTFGRSETTATTLTFSQDFTSEEGATYAWACQGTSKNPNPDKAKFYTTYVSNTLTTTVVTNPTTNAQTIFVNAIVSLLVGIALFFF